MLEFVEWLKVVFLGIVEGITEWLPISSTGHMLLVDEFIKLNVSDAFKDMFFVVIQLGAILAVVVIFWNKMWPFQMPKESQSIIKKDRFSLWFKVVVSCIPEINTKKHTVTFTIDTPDAYTVEFNKKVERAVHIFANEIEKDVPDKDAEGVKYIGPGEWNIEDMVLEDGDTIYISGGAVVHGAVTASFAKDVTVRGRGIIDNSNLEGWKGTSATVPLRFDNCQYVTVEGIISLNANAWCFQGYNSVAGDISNLKIITARPNGDGISLQSCKSFDVENCFVRTWDDSLVVKNYDVNSSNIKFKNVQVWTDLAQSMEIGYETNKGDKENSTIENVTFEDITVLHNFHKPVLSIHNADNAAISNVTYKNIVVEDACMGLGDGTKELIDLQVLTNSGWSTTSDRGTISNVTIDGFKVLYGNESLPSQIKGFDEEHGIDGVSISGLNIKGKDIKSFEDGEFEVDEDTVKNAEIK